MTQTWNTQNEGRSALDRHNVQTSGQSCEASKTIELVNISNLLEKVQGYSANFCTRLFKIFSINQGYDSLETGLPENFNKLFSTQLSKSDFSCGNALIEWGS